MAQRFVLPYQTVFDALGVIAPGAKMNFYEPGTTTPQNTYDDETLTTPNTNPVVADSAGLLPDIWLSEALYRVVATTSADVEIWTADPVSGGPSDIINVKDDGATGNGSTDDAAAFQASIDRITDGDHGIILVPEPSSSYKIDTALNVGTRSVLWMFTHGVSITGTNSTLPGDIMFTSFQSDSRHAFVGNFIFGDENTSGDTGEDPVVFIKRDAGHTGGAAGEKRALSVSSVVGANTTNFETGIVVLIQGSGNDTGQNVVGFHTESRKLAAGASKYWGENVVVKDETGLSAASSGGTVVGTEITISADLTDTATPSRIGLDIAGRRFGGAGTAEFGYGVRVNPEANTTFRTGIFVGDAGGGDCITGIEINAVHSGGRALKIKTDSGAGTFQHGSNVQTATAVVSRIDFFGNNSSAAETTYVTLRAVSNTITAASEDGRLDIQVQIGGTMTTVMQPDGANATNPVSLFVGGSLKRVTEGTTDSGGAGFKYLRVPN